MGLISRVSSRTYRDRDKMDNLASTLTNFFIKQLIKLITASTRAEKLLIIDEQIFKELSLSIQNSQIDGFENFKGACKVVKLFKLQQILAGHVVLPMDYSKAVFLLSEGCINQVDKLVQPWLDISKGIDFHVV